MAKVRLLKGVAHDLVDSFTSATNYISCNYIEYLMAVSFRDQIKDIKIDLFNQTISPGCYRSEDTKICIERYRSWFFRRIEKLGFLPDDFQSLTLHIAIQDIDNTESESSRKLWEMSVTASILMVNGKEIAYTVTHKWPYPDNVEYHKKLIENMDFQGLWRKLSSPELLLIKSLLDESFGKRRLVPIGTYRRSHFALLGKRRNVRMMISLISEEGVYETYKWLEFISRRVANAGGYDFGWKPYFKPLINARIFGSKHFEKIESEVMEEVGYSFVHIRMDMHNKRQFVDIQQELTEKQGFTEALITYNYQNITPYTAKMIHKDTEFLRKLLERVFRFEHVDIQVFE